jgi:pimeloyl-ACP methyl ester carboxylesterase
MTEVVVDSFDAVRIRVHRSELIAGRDHLVVVLPLATRPSFVEAAVRRFAERYNVITWEARLVLEPHVGLADREMLSIQSHLEDVDVILDRFGIEGAFLLGYCSGAALALHIAAANRRIRKLALVNGAYFMKPGECELTQYERDVLDLAPSIAADRARASYLFTKFFAGPGALRRRDHEFAEEVYRPYADADSLHRYGVGLDNLIRGDSPSVAREVKTPALVSSSKRDDQTHWSSSVRIGALLAASETHIDEAGDHYELCRARPDLIARVASFFEGRRRVKGGGDAHG